MPLPPPPGGGLFRGGRPRKSWRYVGVFGDGLMACAAQVAIGPVRQSFWALWLDGGPQMRERTRLLPRRGEVLLGREPGRLTVRDMGVDLDLELYEQEGFVAHCPHGREEVWTRKQAGIAATGTLALDDSPPRAVRALAVIDDTIGYHARRTEWRWSAGVGQAPDGTPLAWNLVSGVNDPPHGSERAVWVDGVAHEVGPVAFAEDLSRVHADDGSGELRFEAVAERSRRDELLILSSDYRAPFGTFSGTLPGGIALARGRGVMEHHRARW